MEECLICGRPLVYTTTERPVECVVCHRQFFSRVSCEGGHYVCDDCHGKDAVAWIEAYCLRSEEKNPVAVARALMDQPYVHMHGNEHHVLVGAALLTAYYHSGGAVAFAEAMAEIVRRGREVPGGACGFWGACGAAVSAGIFVSVVTGATPLSQDAWGLANTMTSRALAAIGAIGGPRCCKRDSFTAICQAVSFCREKLGVSMEMPESIECTYYVNNNQCLGRRCPYHLKGSGRKQEKENT